MISSFLSGVAKSLLLGQIICFPPMSLVFPAFIQRAIKSPSFFCAFYCLVMDFDCIPNKACFLFYIEPLVFTWSHSCPSSTPNAFAMSLSVSLLALEDEQSLHLNHDIITCSRPGLLIRDSWVTCCSINMLHFMSQSVLNMGKHRPDALTDLHRGLTGVTQSLQ